MFYWKNPIAPPYPPAPAIFIFLFFCFSLSCAHFKSLKLSNSLNEAQSQNKKGEKPLDFLMQGLDLFRQSKFNEARKTLEKLSYGDKGFLSAILEIQKINYIERDWDRFFGLASYYRKKLLYSREMAIKNFRQEMLALEILALLRHCLLSEAIQVAEWGLALAKNIQKDSSKIQKSLHFLKLKTQIGEKKRQRTDWEKQINLWPVSPESIKGLDNPKYVRMKVDSKC